MATPEDLKANAEFIRLADAFVEVPGGKNSNNYTNVDVITRIAKEVREVSVGSISNCSKLTTSTQPNFQILSFHNHSKVWMLSGRVGGMLLRILRFRTRLPLLELSLLVQLGLL